MSCTYNQPLSVAELESPDCGSWERLSPDSSLPAGFALAAPRTRAKRQQRDSHSPSPPQGGDPQRPCHP